MQLNCELLSSEVSLLRRRSDPDLGISAYSIKLRS